MKKTTFKPIDTKYTYSDLITIINGMYDENRVSEQNSIDWAVLQKGATDSIIEKLYHLENDTQRTGFLNATFRGFFNDGKDYNLSLAESGGGTESWNESERQYLINCKLTLNGVVDDVSDACIQYKGIDFTRLMKENIRTMGVEAYRLFTWYVKPTEKSQLDIITDVNLASKTDLEIDISGVLLKIKFDKNEDTKKRVRNILTELNERKLLTDSIDKEFTAIASILYNTGWVVNINTFTAWLLLLSNACNRVKKPNYKESGVKDSVKQIKQKYQFLDSLPSK